MLLTRFISLDEFREYFVDVDLRASLGSEESATAFLVRIEDRLETFIDANFNKSVENEYRCFTDYQKKHFKRALLEQAIYIFRNGDVSVDSGYDQDKGVIADINTIKQVSIAPNCKQELVLCGLWDRNLQSKGLGWMRMF